MGSDITITDSEEGKKVVDNHGEEIGRITEVRGGTAYIDPDPGMTDTIMSKLGWSSREEDTYPLDEEDVEAVTEDEVQIRSM